MHKRVKAETNMLFLLCLTSFTNGAAPGAASVAPQGTGSAELPLGTGTSLPWEQP